MAQAIAPMFDAGGLAGQPFTRQAPIGGGGGGISWGTSNIVIPAADDQYDGGRYWDVLQFLNGYGNQEDLADDILAKWISYGGTPTRTFTVGIDANDRFYVQIDGQDANDEFSIAPGSASRDYFGLGGTVVATAYGTGLRATAAGPWQRGPIDFQNFLTEGRLLVNKLGGGGGVGSFYAPSNRSKVSSIPTLLRYNVQDTDDATLNCLEFWDNDTFDPNPGGGRIKWGIDSDGHVFSSWPQGVGDLSWRGTAAAVALRNALGFTGNEVISPVVIGGRQTVTAAYVCPSLLFLTRGFSRWNERLVQDSSVVQMLSGELRGRKHYTAVEYDLSFSLKGPTATRDESAWALRRVFPLLTKGARCSVYLRWGDPRRSRSEAELFTGRTTDVIGASASNTTLFSGLEGRRMCRVSSASADDFAVEFQSNAPRVISGGVSMTLREASDNP